MSELRVSFPKPCSESWEGMRSEGCNRFCERCEKTIYDLSKLSFEEVESLTRSGEETCVRAQVDADGLVELRRDAGRNGRRIVATIGASVGLLAAISPASAAGGVRLGAIKGEVIGACGGGGRVSAIDSGGSTYHAKVGVNGRYKVKGLPPGTYQVRVELLTPEPTPDTGGSNTQDRPARPVSQQVNVEAGRTSVMDLSDPEPCIIIGMIRLDDGKVEQGA